MINCDGVLFYNLAGTGFCLPFGQYDWSTICPTESAELKIRAGMKNLGGLISDL